MMVRSLLLVFFLLCSSLSAEIRTLTILHVNDIHSRLIALENGRGGFAYLAAAINKERAGCKDCILLNGGDLAQGSPVSTMYKALPVFQIANQFKFNAATLGNHDFDYGYEQTTKLIGASKYPLVSSNVVGVIGVMTDQLHTLAFPKNLGKWHTISSVETARKYAAEIKGKCDLVVALGHITAPEEQAFLKEQDIHVIVSVHIHSGLEKAMESPDHVLVRTKNGGEELGRLELKIDTVKKAPVSWTWKKIDVIDANITPVPAVAKKVKVWEDKVTAIVDAPLAVSDRDYTKAEVKAILEDSMREAAGADLAYMNLGGVRALIPKGPLKVRNAWNVMPFDNLILYGTFKGRDLPELVTAGHTIDPDKDYKLAVPDFIAATALPKLAFPNEAGLQRDALIAHLKKKWGQSASR